MCIFQTASRRHLLCCILLAILFTLIARPQSVGATPQRHSLPSHLLTSGNTSIWAGYMATSAQSQGTTFTEVNMYFTVPTIKVTPGQQSGVGIWGKKSGVAIWAGVGYGTMLAQAGISFGTDFNGNPEPLIKAVWETFSRSDDAQGIMTQNNGAEMDVKPDDQIWVYVSSGNSDHNSGYDGFLLEDLTQHTYAVHYEYAKDKFGDPGSAECIVERPAVTVPTNPPQSAFEALANFGPKPITITGCGVYTNKQIQPQYAMVPIGNFSPIQLNMIGKNNVPLANTSDLRNGTDFDVTWQNTGIPEPITL